MVDSISKGVGAGSGELKSNLEGVFGDKLKYYKRFANVQELSIIVKECNDAKVTVDSTEDKSDFMFPFYVSTNVDAILGSAASPEDKKQSLMKLFILVPDIISTANVDGLNNLLSDANSNHKLTGEQLVGIKDQLDKLLKPEEDVSNESTTSVGQTQEEKREEVSQTISQADSKDNKNEASEADIDSKQQKKGFWGRSKDYMSKPMRWGPLGVLSPLVPKGVKKSLEKGGTLSQKLRGGPFGFTVPASKIKSGEGYSLLNQFTGGLAYTSTLITALVALALPNGNLDGLAHDYPKILEVKETVIDKGNQGREFLINYLGGFNEKELSSSKATPKTIKITEQDLIEAFVKAEEIVNQKNKEKEDYAKGARTEPVHYNMEEFKAALVVSKLKGLTYSFDKGVIDNGGKPIRLDQLGEIEVRDFNSSSGTKKVRLLEDASFANVTFKDKVFLNSNSSVMDFSETVFEKGYQLGSLDKPEEEVNLSDTLFVDSVIKDKAVVVAKKANLNGFAMDGAFYQKGLTFIAPKNESSRKDFSADLAVIRGENVFTHKGLVEKAEENILGAKDFDNTKHIAAVVSAFQEKVKAGKEINQSDVDALFKARDMDPGVFNIDFSKAFFPVSGINFAGKDLSKVKFNGAVFQGPAIFDRAKLLETDYTNARFLAEFSSKDTDLSKAIFKGTYFSNHIPGRISNVDYKETAKEAKLKIKDGKEINQTDVDALAYLAKETKSELDLEGAVISGDLNLGGRYCVGANFKNIKVNGNVNVTGSNIANSNWTGAKVVGDITTDLGAKWDWDPTKVEKDISKTRNFADVQKQMIGLDALANHSYSSFTNVNMSSIECTGSIKLVGPYIHLGGTGNNYPKLDGAKIAGDVVIVNTMYNNLKHVKEIKLAPWRLSLDKAEIGGNAIIVGNFQKLSIDKAELGKEVMIDNISRPSNKNSKLFLGGFIYGAKIENNDFRNVYIKKDTKVANSKININEAKKVSFWETNFENTKLVIRNSEDVEFVGGKIYSKKYKKEETDADPVKAEIELEDNSNYRIHRDNETGEKPKIYKGVKYDKGTKNILRKNKVKFIDDKISYNSNSKKTSYGKDSSKRRASLDHPRANGIPWNNSMNNYKKFAVRQGNTFRG